MARKPRLTPDLRAVLEALEYEPTRAATADLIDEHLKLKTPGKDLLARLVAMGYAEPDEHEPDWHHITDDGQEWIEEERDKEEERERRREEREMRAEDREFAAYERDLERQHRELERAVAEANRKPTRTQKPRSTKRPKRKKKASGCSSIITLAILIGIIALVVRACPETDSQPVDTPTIPTQAEPSQP